MSLSYAEIYQAKLKNRNKNNKEETINESRSPKYITLIKSWIDNSISDKLDIISKTPENIKIKYLKDDMVVVEDNYTFFKELDMNYVDWANVLFSIENKLNLSLDRARTPDPESVSLGSIAKDIEKVL